MSKVRTIALLVLAATATVWEYARMAKSYSPSLKERCRLTPLLAYSVTGWIAQTPYS
jgi:hypothetical protein